MAVEAEVEPDVGAGHRGRPRTVWSNAFTTVSTLARKAFEEFLEAS